MIKLIIFLEFLFLNQEVTSSDGVCDCKGLALIGSGNNCTIVSRKWNEFLYSEDGVEYDKQRRQIFTWIPGGCDNEICIWKLETTHTTSGHKFQLKNVYFDEYLYAAMDDLKYDKQRRNTFGWIPRSACDNDQCYWEIQLLQDGSKYFTIKNVAFNEYLYAADGLNYDNERRRVFTWSEDYDVGNDHASHWAIHCL